MNIAGASQTTLIDYLSLKGRRQIIESEDDGSEKAAAVKFLSKLECLSCKDVFEKPLSTRCCDKILCADCYLSFPDPKKCPIHRLEFSGSIQDDLKCQDRLIINQIEESVGLFKDIPSTETSIDKHKGKVQNDAIQLINSSTTPSTGITRQPARQNEMVENAGGYDNVNYLSSSESGNISSSFGNRAFNFQASGSYSLNSFPDIGMNFRSAGNLLHVVAGDGINLNGRQIQGSNLVIHNGEVVSGHNVTVTTPGRQRTPVREYDFREENVDFIDIHTRQGDILIKGQCPVNRHQVSVISSREPSLRNNNLNLNCNENVQLRLPESFVGGMQLHTNMGDIITHRSYRIKSGGRLHTNMGDINVKVDSLLVNACGRTNMGGSVVNVQNHYVHWGRQALNCESNMGNVYIYDQG
ncbi:hypothetical protein J7438_16840 [Thalassotalea sp. G20_0]|uniref:hypothetical protein n=1 Tax=Thalassotalea sp. G20_0 TaxID=2821093 RepID=UPI001ADB2088|nr:hypothetical protein [Thalassotalea sp. G20_0]MBO9495742.1 hypothetical protein [Thalassotalea sp. G20_0]